MLDFFLSNLFNNFWRFLISTKWTFNQSIIFKLMLSPLCKAFQMEGISAYCGTSCSCIAFNYLHVADGTKIIFVISFLFFDNHVFSRDIDLDIFQKIRHFIVMNSTICDDVSKFFICILLMKQQLVLIGQIKYF